MPHQKDTLMKELLQIVQQEGPESLRSLLQTVCQAVLEAQMTQVLQAERYERTQKRRGYRNGYKPRTLTIRLGTLELRVPQDREGRFCTQLFARYQRSEQALLLCLQQMYLKGVSTRKVQEITEALCDTGFSAAVVSELTQKLEAQLEAWRNRPLTQPYPYLMVDARYEHVRVNHRIQSWGVLIIKGIAADGHREILSVELGNSENEATWAEVFKRLWERGLRGVIYGVSDNHGGLKAAVARYFQGVIWQRCQVHYQRDAQKRGPAGERAPVAARLRDVFNASDLAMAQQRLRQVMEGYGASSPRLATWLEETGEEALAVFHLPPAHRVRLRSTNGLEAFHGEIDRRTRVVRIFPDEGSCLRLITALAMERSEAWLLGPCYLDMRALEEREGLKPQGKEVAMV